MMSQNFPFHPELDMSQFRVLNPNLISYSTSELRVCARCLSFNVATIIELGYPTHVCLCSTYDGQQIVLKAFSESELKTVEDLALPFYRRDDTQPKKRITMASKAIADSVRLTMGWDSSTVMKTKGIFYPSHQLILFDLRQAVPLSQKMSGKKQVPLTEYPTFEEVAKSLPPQVLALTTVS